MGMEFKTKEDFENYLISVIEKAGGISIADLSNSNFPNGLKLKSKDKDLVKKLYSKHQKSGFRRLISEIIQNHKEIVCINKMEPEKYDWIYEVERKKDSVDSNTVKNIEEKSDVKTEAAVTSVTSSNAENEEKVRSDEEDDTLPKPETGSTGKKNKSSVNKDLKKSIEKNMVQVTDDFYISKYEITQNLYEKVMGNNPSTFKDESTVEYEWKGLPVETVSFNDALEFCNKLSEQCGYEPCYDSNGNYDDSKNGFRLPTEKEWNYVANGGADKPKNKFAGDDLAYGLAWFMTNSGSSTHEVGKKRPLIINEKEIFDITGNVWEWCWSSDQLDKAVCYGGSYEDSEVYLELGINQNKDILSKKDRKKSVGFRISVNLLK